MKTPIKTDEIIEKVCEEVGYSDDDWEEPYSIDYLLQKAIQLTQSKIISIIDKKIEELKKHESNEIEYFDPTTSETEDIIEELQSLKKDLLENEKDDSK